MLTSFRQPTKRFLLTLWLPLQAAVVVGCLVLAARTYPGYGLVGHDISFLGHPHLNPRGWWCWSLAMATSGAMLWPVATYISRASHALTAAASASQRRLSTLAACSLRGSSLGLFGLALVPQLPGFDHAHELSGVLAMGGMYVALWLVVAILIYSSAIRPAQALLLVVAVGWGPAGYLLTQGWRVWAYGPSGNLVGATPAPAVLDFSLWEWLLYICLFAAELAVVWLLPDEGPAETPDPG